MKSIQYLVVLILLSCVLPVACSAVDIDLVSAFPRWRNGENNIFLQYREEGEYHDLVPMGMLVFAHPDSPSTVPYAGPVISLGTRANLSAESYTNPDRIFIRPAMEKPSQADRAGVIRIIPPLPEGRVDITGEAGMEGTYVPMAIYHGEANYSSPLWSSAVPGRFEVSYSFTGSEPVFFAASAPGNDMKSKGYWKGVTLSFSGDVAGTPAVTMTGTPIPATAGPADGQLNFTPYIQSIAVILAALISSVTALWIARHKKE